MNAQISEDGTYLSVPLKHRTARFHAMWLRDNARDPDTISPQNGQRVITLLDQPGNSLLESASLTDRDCLSVKFIGNPKEYGYSLEWLDKHCYDNNPREITGWTAKHIQRWDASLQSGIPSVDYTQAAESKESLGGWLAKIRKFGFATMTGLLPQSDSLLKVVGLFGFVRETNYGQFFEVRSEINPVNLAYTGLGLQAHTDNPYRDPVPTLQILSCIKNTAEGGESIVVDGFKVAEVLQKENEEHFELLSRYCARFRYAGSSDVNLTSKRPMIELNPDGELIGIRFNNRSAAPFVDIPFEQMPAYYRAYRHFAEILEREENEVSFRLGPNELFIVDNTRVMHSRNAFSGEGTRWLRGCYADKDGLLSTLSVIESEQGKKAS